MDDETYQILSNIGDDLKSMAEREDKSIIIDRTAPNDERLAAFAALTDAGVVSMKAGMKMVIITLEL